MDIGGLILIVFGITLIWYVFDLVIIKLFPNSETAKRKRNQDVIDKATAKAYVRHRAAIVHVDAEGNVTEDEE